MARKACYIATPKERIDYELSRIMSIKNTEKKKVALEALVAYAKLHGFGQLFGEPAHGGTIEQPAPPISERTGIDELSFEERMKARRGPEETKG